MNRQERLENLSAYIDGELTEAEQRWLAAWCESHPEDVAEFDGVTEAVRLVRQLPEAEPPAWLRDRIVNAVRETVPVAATREQALEWLDRYFDGDLAEPQRLVVEHYLAVDAEFAQTAEVHRAMLSALGGMADAEPPSDLRYRIEASVRRRALLGAQPTLRASRPGLAGWPARRLVTVSLAAAAVFLVSLSLGRAGRGLLGGDGSVGDVTASQPTVAPVVEPAPVVVEAPAVEPVVDVEVAAEPLPVEGPAVPGEMLPDAPATVRVRQAEPSRPQPQVANAERRREPAVVAPEVAPRAVVRDRVPSPPVVVPPKPSPPAVPVSPYSERPSAISRDGAGRVVPDDPEVLERSGTGSVLGDDNFGGSGNNGRGHGSLDSRGPVDPTRQIEAPSF